MILVQEREAVVRYCREMLDENLTTGTGGNISVFSPKEKYFAISPSGKDYRTMVPEDVIVLDLDLNIIDGSLKPSSEFAMHGIFYQNRSDVNAVVHTHSLYATAMACLGWNLPPFYYLNMIAGTDVQCCPYARYGTKELAEFALKGMEKRNAVLLSNHGLLTGSKTIEKAFNIAQIIEKACHIYLTCRSTGVEPNLLSNGQVDEMLEVFHNRGY